MLKKWLLIIVIILLSSNLFVWALSKPVNSYATSAVQYRAVQLRSGNIQEVLDKYSKEGWELVAVVPNDALSLGHLIFKK